MTAWTRPCTCGVDIIANPEDPFPAVNEHIEGRTHRAWSDTHSWFPRTTAPDPTTRPSPVDLSSAPRVRPVMRRRPRVRVVMPR